MPPLSNSPPFSFTSCSSTSVPYFHYAYAYHVPNMPTHLSHVPPFPCKRDPMRASARSSLTPLPHLRHASPLAPTNRASCAGEGWTMRGVSIPPRVTSSGCPWKPPSSPTEYSAIYLHIYTKRLMKGKTQLGWCQISAGDILEGFTPSRTRRHRGYRLRDRDMYERAWDCECCGEVRRVISSLPAEAAAPHLYSFIPSWPSST
ncbi:hypothetical protein CK203_057689 [Vitis vinifera]|uniref:Uncharacterized protein n=1 Tax=Vitis vinifera TaxID=29760 RepID=A0A438G0K4_VITVI|nr:hypothetical protein CK203_057689 [Vitis vinifera]